MIIELQKEQFSIVKNLLTDIDLQIICLGVINQDIDGQIWVDDIIKPKTAMMIDNIWVIYLLGDSGNSEFNIQAGEIINNYILPKQLEDKEVHREWIVDFFSDDWKQKINAELGLLNSFEVELWHYKLETLKLTNWRELIPPDYEVQQVDEEFFSKSYLVNYSNIANWITQRWKNTADFLKRAFCFYIVKDSKEIVSFAMTDWATENYIIMGIDTDEKYRKQGFASIVSAAAAEYCISRDIDLRWFCSSENIGSWKTAEKVGFKKIVEQTIIMGENKKKD